MTMNDHTKSLLQALIDGKVLERRISVNDWSVVPFPGFAALAQTPHEYLRVKQPTIRIGEVDVPEPLRVAPKDGTAYWLADATRDYLYSGERWVGDNSDHLWLSCGLVHLSEEAAIAHAKALILVSGGTV